MQYRSDMAMAIASSLKGRAAAIRATLDGPVRRRRHIVDTLIEERAGRLLDHPLLWQALCRTLHPLLKYDEAVEIADQVADLGGYQVFSHMSRTLRLHTEVRGLEHVPKNGFLFVCANHPTGIADGIAVFDALSPVRPDLCFMANRDAIRVAEGLSDMIIPVDWRKDHRTPAKTRETVQGLGRAKKEERPVVIFPSGRLAYLTPKGLAERPWLPTTVTLARRYGAPILPLRVISRNSALYYALAMVSSELRDITVFNELLNKTGRMVRLTFGPTIDPGDLDDDAEIAIAQLQRLVEHDMA